MKKIVICVCLGIAPAFAFVNAQTTSDNHQAWELNTLSVQTTLLWTVTREAAGDYNSCIKRCADTRDKCTANACNIIGTSNGPQACTTNPSKNTPANHAIWEKANKACFDQDAKCQAACR